MPENPPPCNLFIAMAMCAQYTPNVSMRTFHNWEAAVPFPGRLHAVFSAPVSALSWTEKAAGQFVMQKTRMGAASQWAADPEHA